MTDVAIDRCAEGGTSQCGPQVARARAERGGGCLVVVAPVRNVAPSGLPIHRRGPVDRPTSAGCRDGDSSDVQAAAQPSTSLRKSAYVVSQLFVIRAKGV